jgi:glycosyltransferase involved in cell wall biosynthesis
LKIAMVRSTLHRGSGQAVHIRELSKHLTRLGNRVTVFSRKIEDQTLSQIGHELKFSLDNTPFVRHLSFASACLSGIRDFDLVHTQYHPEIIAGNWLHEFRKMPHVFTYHGFSPIGIWKNPFQRLKMIDHRIGAFFSLRFGFDRVISVSQFLKRELVEWYHLNPEIVQVIHNGVDLERFNPQVDGSKVREDYSIEDCPVVAFIGRLAPYKGPQFLLEAIPRVLREIPEVKFIFVGSSRFETPKIAETMMIPRIRDTVIFTGYVNDEILPNFYASCDVFCYPSLWEGFGLTPAEAQATGKPVVAFKTCALPEVVQDEVTGLLVRARDSQALAEAIVRLLRNPDLRVKMGRQARHRTENMFSWDKIAQETLGVYEGALEVHSRHQ